MLFFFERSWDMDSFLFTEGLKNLFSSAMEWVCFGDAGEV